jgi:GDP-L-fucose synthase
MESHNDSGLVNMGVGDDISILDLALNQKKLSSSKEVLTDPSKPDELRELMDVSKLNNLGWKAQITLEEDSKRII